MKKIISILILSALISVASAQCVTTTNSDPGLINNTIRTKLNCVQPYKKIVTRVTQSSTTAPVDTSLEDNQSTAHTWHYITVGDYRIKCSSCFSTTKTLIFMGNTVSGAHIRAWVISTDSVGVQTSDTSNVKANAMLTNTPFEIRMYP